MPSASDFTRMKRMIASANVYSPASPSMWTPTVPIVLPNMIWSNKFMSRSSIPDVDLRGLVQGGGPFSSPSIFLSGGDPYTQTETVYSGGFP